jgi:hypothetical protein
VGGSGGGGPAGSGGGGRDAGENGDANTGGTAGSGASGGVGGAGGDDARGGSGGAAGSAGSSGTMSGSGGGAGAAGSGASAGTGGASGSAGTAGTAGSAGVGGIDGGTGGGAGMDAGGGRGGASGAAGAGGSLDGGGSEGGGGSCPSVAVYCDDFERYTSGSMPIGWTRVGGSSGDWQVLIDTNNVFAQSYALSSTFRLCYASGAAGAPWSGATTVSARVKILARGTSGIPMALLCLGYGSGDYACIALQEGGGARIRMNPGTSPVDGPLWPATIAAGTWDDVKLSVDATGAMSAYLNGALLGSYMPPNPIASGYVAVATQSAEAVFDTVAVTQP